MQDLLLGIVSALWLGILTSISPCPLATNIAAISYAGRRLSRPHTVLLTGVIYTLGRMLLYVILGIIIVMLLLSVPSISSLLQKYMHKITGPVLILVGMILLELMQFNFPGSGVNERTRNRLDSRGMIGAFVLGIVFALSFCPVSAALFFGSLVPLSIRFDSIFVIPAVFGLGTGLPVIIFAGLLAYGAQSIGRMFNVITRIELWFRRVTGVVLIGIGLYFSLKYIFRLF